MANSRKKKRSRILLLAILGVGISILSTLNMGDSMVYFYTPAEAAVKVEDLQGKTIRLGAMVKEGTVEWVAEDLRLTFVLTDYKGQEITVRHKGTPPDLFKEGAGVVVEGSLGAQTKNFTSKRMFVKHSEEYQAPHHQGESIDHELLKKSIFKNESTY